MCILVLVNQANSMGPLWPYDCLLTFQQAVATTDPKLPPRRRAKKRRQVSVGSLAAGRRLCGAFRPFGDVTAETPALTVSSHRQPIFVQVPGERSLPAKNGYSNNHQ